MHEEQNNAPVKTVQSNRQEANFPNLEEKENLKQFYLTQSRRLCPTVSVDRSELQRLGALHHKIKHFIKALTNLDRSWENGMPEMQKACLHFFSLQNSPRTECQKIFEEWAKWSNFLISASCYRGFVSQMLQDYQRQLPLVFLGRELPFEDKGYGQVKVLERTLFDVFNFHRVDLSAVTSFDAIFVSKAETLIL